VKETRDRDPRSLILTARDNRGIAASMNRSSAQLSVINHRQPLESRTVGRRGSS